MRSGARSAKRRISITAPRLVCLHFRGFRGKRKFHLRRSGLGVHSAAWLLRFDRSLLREKPAGYLRDHLNSLHFTRVANVMMKSRVKVLQWSRHEGSAHER